MCQNCGETEKGKRNAQFSAAVIKHLKAAHEATDEI